MYNLFYMCDGSVQVYGRHHDPLAVWASLRNHGVNPDVVIPILNRIQSTYFFPWWCVTSLTPPLHTGIAAGIQPSSHTGSAVWNSMDRWANDPSTHPRAARKYKLLRQMTQSIHSVYTHVQLGTYDKLQHTIAIQSMRTPTTTETTAMYNAHRDLLMPPRSLSAIERAVDRPPTTPPPDGSNGGGHRRRLLSTQTELTLPFIELADSAKQCAVATDLVKVTEQTMVDLANYYVLLLPTILSRLYAPFHCVVVQCPKTPPQVHVSRRALWQPP